MDKQSVQVSALTVEEAIRRGLSLLGLTRDEVDIEIIEEGRRGILGIGTREATVHLVARTPAAKMVPQAEPVPAPVEPPPVQAQEQSQEYELSEPQIAEISRQVLEELLGKMGIEAQVTVQLDETPSKSGSPIRLDVQGNDLDNLVGRRGQVLNALQHITRLIVSRETEHWIDLVVDVEKYKERRANSLQKLAQRMADRVAQSQQPIALEPMPPNERREIHIALRNHPQVTTQSVGRGDGRKVTIIPKH
ncbi:MAG: protein jag [Anaerolineae bacterium]|nr:protein jag [Anaerolineae bacterium]